MKNLYFSRIFFAAMAAFASNRATAQRTTSTVDGGTVDLTTCEKTPSEYNIQLQYMGVGDPDPRYEEAFQLAAIRWSKIIVGDVPDVRGGTVDDWFGGQFPGRSYTEAVDDVVIGYNIPDTLDGPGGTLGAAGPVFVRRDAFRRPTSTISGIMEFDGLDLDAMSTNDVKLIILHEMGHVLGLVGTTSGRCTNACDSTNPLEQTQYACAGAANEYEAIAPGELFLENNGGMGTACGHFEERSFRSFQSSEIMTGFFEADLFQPISSVTVAALQDIGYEVDFCGADIWPADDETIKRFVVYKASQEMDMDTVLDPLSPRWTMEPETGETTEFSWEDDAGAATAGPEESATPAPEASATPSPTAGGISLLGSLSIAISAALAVVLL
ncbi:PKD domain containing protein [Seminavis robusta]|uniref:PKD domain containing protein n=1 Tax=Seminavis robusta TaxID=568900 RepID=A0A9N8E8F4_9STRA|nr:PKD domain containing protein [Seminavis robusta]|eukprot:Sro735_g194900.1 PKD domain containing protein (383) ;mRNA; r:29285-30522